ncbi:hypothetical protein [Bradyrhizobium liaoningense]
MENRTAKDDRAALSGTPRPEQSSHHWVRFFKEVAPLQAADTVVHTALKWAEAHLKSDDADQVPFFKEMQPMISLHTLFTLGDIELFRRIAVDNVERLKENTR